MFDWQIQGWGVRDEAVLRALREVPRQIFVPEEQQQHAYEDRPLPIGFGQTISQPYMVAAMTDLLRLTPASRVLEIGTGSGYQAAILSRLASQAYTVEIIPQLYALAQERLRRLGYMNVHLRCADGYEGWADEAPFDGIIVTCAPLQVPPCLVSQLADGGRLVIPIGPAGSYQVLHLLRREGTEMRDEEVMAVAFVPFTGPHAH